MYTVVLRREGFTLVMEHNSVSPGRQSLGIRQVAGGSCYKSSTYDRQRVGRRQPYSLKRFWLGHIGLSSE